MLFAKFGGFYAYCERLRAIFFGRQDAAAKGRVTGVTFLGGYYEIEVELASSRLLVRADSNSYQKGQAVFVGLAP